MITVTTKATGAATNPVMTLTPTLSGTIDDPLIWTCRTTAGQFKHVPAVCRN